MFELALKYEELENLLSNMPEPKRLEILGDIVSQSYLLRQSYCFHEYSIKDMAKCNCL